MEARRARALVTMEAGRASGRAAMEAGRQIGKRARTAGTVDAELRLGPPDSGGASAGFMESKYVKVSVEGAQYQRKVDLMAYGGHAELRAALLGLAGQMLDLAVCYEDEAGDVMLAGDHPWDMFVSDCRSVRIMRRSTMMTSS